MEPEKRVENNILEQLDWNSAIDAENVKVEVKDKTVFLKGSVQSYNAKVIALRDAMQVAPDYDIENEIIVKFEPQQNELVDTEITSNIQQFLKWNSDINPVNLQVETENGEVTLSGNVAKRWEKSEAEKIANSARGVVNVVNKIAVKPMAVRADDYIEKDLKRVFERSSLVDEESVHVEVNNGVVYLTGSVISSPVLNEIVEKALYTNGVVDVVDEITIQ